MNTIPWEADDYRSWYCYGQLLRWKCGLPRLMPDEWIEAFYYNTPDDFIEWDAEPKKTDWGDTYDIDEDERKDEDGIFVAEHILSLGR